MIFKLFKNFLKKRKVIEEQPIYPYNTGLLYRSKNFDIYTYELLDDEVKFNIFWEMYKTNSIINNAVNLLVSGILSQKFEVVDTDEESKVKINYYLNSSNFYRLLEKISLDYIIQGFVLYQLYYTNNEIQFAKVNKSNVNIDKDLGLIKIKEKSYSIDHFVYLENESLLLPLIPLHNIIKLTEDSLFSNLVKFTFPILKVLTKNKLSVEKQQEVYRKIKQYFEDKTALKTLVFFLEEGEIDFTIEKPENVLESYIDIISMFEVMIYKNLGILPTLSAETSGSYAKAKVQENIFRFNIEKITRNILEELNRKYIPKVAYVLECKEGRVKVKEQEEV